MALDFANAGQLPNPPKDYSPEHIKQAWRVLEIYFGQLDSMMWNHAERYTARQFVVRGDENGEGGFYGGRFFGDGNYLSKDTQRFLSLATQNPGPVGSANLVKFESAAFVNSITLVAPGKLTVSLPGAYKFDYSLSFSNISVTTTNVAVWWRLNGVDIPNSASYFSVPGNGWVRAAMSIMPTLAAGDFLEVAWFSAIPEIFLIVIGALPADPGVKPPIPATSTAVVNAALLQAPMPADAELPLPRRLRPP